MEKDVYEKLGAFYLGKKYNLANKEIENSPTLLRSKDLTTHAFCVGMTGSGKTGLCISLLEEAAIDNVPIIAIDPKGDLPNLMLGFEDMRAECFKPWVNESEAAQKEITVDQLALEKSEEWQKGIAAWGQDSSRIEKIKTSVDIRVYTPGSDAGINCALIGGLEAPLGLDSGTESFREAVEHTADTYLSLVGVVGSDFGSPQHSFLSQILKFFWAKGRSLTFADFIGAILNPPFESVGALNLELFFPKKERLDLALKFNALYASPKYKNWTKGKPLSTADLLYSDGGKPQISILSVAHLEEKERQFFIAQTLNDLVSWTRKQKGTNSLRALLYMDEIYGYFPPVKNPPTKKPMLTLLKQARAHGVGCVLATQNPVDLDYKGLSNIGTWFIGRLQTESDKGRLLEGLSSLQSDISINWSDVISSLEKRVFVLHSVHLDAPEVFHTRWALSFLSGPISSKQISKLMEPYKSQSEDGKEVRSSSSPFSPFNLPKEIKQKKLGLIQDEERLLQPYWGAAVKIHFVHRKSGESMQVEEVWTSQISQNNYIFSLENFYKEDLVDLNEEGRFKFAEVPSYVQSESVVRKTEKEFLNHVYRSAELILWEHPGLRMFSSLGQDEKDFRGELVHRVKERKDHEIDKLTSKYESRIKLIEARIMRAEQKVSRETEQYSTKKSTTLLNIGVAVASILMGEKVLSGASARKAGSVFKGASGTQKEKNDIVRAEEQLASYRTDLEKLKDDLEDEVLKMEDRYSAGSLKIIRHNVVPTKNNIDVTWCGVLWK